MATINLGGGVVVSDDQVRAAGYDPNAIREAMAFGTSVPFGSAPSPGHAAGKIRLAIDHAVTARSVCAKYEDAVKNNLPPAIQTSLRHQCDASKAAATAAGAPDGDTSSDGVSPIVIVGGVAALGAAAWFLFLRKR